MPSAVSSICADQKGYVWVGSPDGLLRYEGAVAKRYLSYVDNKSSLPSEDIISVLCDSLANLWVLTQRGVALYNYETDDFTPVHLEQTDSPFKASSACLAPGGILFGGQNEIYRYDYSSGKIALLCTFSTVFAPIYNIETIAFWHDFALCYNRWNGVIFVDPNSGAVSEMMQCSRENFGMMVDMHHNIWLSPYNKGIECYAPSGALIARYNTKNSALSHDIVLTMVEKYGKIWIGTDGGGVNILDPETGEISAIRHIPGNSNSLPDNSIKALSFDNQDNLWVGRVKGGLCVVHNVWMQHFSDCPQGQTHGLSEKNINCLYQEPTSLTIWVGTNGEGLNAYDPQTNSFTHYPSTSRLKITSIISYSPTELLLSTFSLGVYIFDKLSGRLTQLSLESEPLNYQMRYSGRAVHLLGEERGSFLLLCDSVYRYRDGVVEQISTQSKRVGSAESIGNFNGKAYFHDRQSIFELSPQSSQAQRVFKMGADTVLSCVYLDRAGIFWIGTNRGVGAFNPQTNHYEQLKTTLFGAVKSVIHDDSGRLWVGTDHELFAYVQATKSFAMFDQADGALPNEYRPKARLVSLGGDIYMGGVNGLLRIDGSHYIPRSDDFPLVLTNVQVDGQPLYGTSRNLKLSSKTKTLQLRVAAYGSDMFDKKLYRFRVSGLLDGVLQSYDPEITLSTTSYGKFSVEVSCVAADGRVLPWNNILNFTIAKPWYRTTTFGILCFLMVALGGFLVALRIYIKRERMLEAEYQERTRQVNEEKIRFLTEVCHEMEAPLTLVNIPLKKLLEPSQELSEKEKMMYLNMIRMQAQKMKGLIQEHEVNTRVEAIEKDDQAYDSSDETFIAKLNKIIEENIDNPDLSIPRICAEIAMSRTSLYNKVLALTGLNIKDYINKIRMEKAIDLLQKSDLSIADISEKLGFSSSRYFSTAFKAYVGASPTDFRKLL